MIERYSTLEMSQLWSSASRFQFMLNVEQAVAKIQAQQGIIPKKAYQDIKAKAKIQESRIFEIEKTVKHDVIAFVSQVAESVGPSGRYLHFGLTSSDVLDTALSLQIQAAGQLLLKEIADLKRILKSQTQAHAKTLCAGRTHGMWAEPTTFGVKLAGFYAELERNEQRLQQACLDNKICKLSGAVGTYSALDPQFESLVAQELDLIPETVATQVIPRDRHAQWFTALAFLLTGYERLAIELRHLQRSEVGEVRESFNQGQKGSSAMPHKQNPISAENLTGLARMMRSYQQAALENIALWHERDISHSSVERVFFPDSAILAHYATRRLKDLVQNLDVQAIQMQKNVEQSLGLLMSSHLLLMLIEKGWSREKAYAEVQRLSFEAKTTGQHLRTLIPQQREWQGLYSQAEWENLFSGQRHLRHAPEIVKRALRSKSKVGAQAQVKLK